MSENIRNAWKSQAWLDTQQVSKRQIQLKQKRRPLNLSLEVSAKRNDPTSIEWWNCWTSWKEKNKWHGINGGDLRKFNAPSPDPDRSQTNRNESDGYDKNNNVNINSHVCKQFQIWEGVLRYRFQTVVWKIPRQRNILKNVTSVENHEEIIIYTSIWL